MNNAVVNTLIFDLDGTLIDSSTSILAGFAAALSVHKIEPGQPLTPEIIGPPLRKTLSLLSGSNDPDLLDALTASFKDYYDTEGYKATLVFPDVENMLRLAHRRGAVLHIATNKRLLPTSLILEHLGWRDLFTSVYALDKAEPAYTDKSHMLAEQLKEQQIPVDSAAYIGDRPEDGQAADANGLTFFAADWGYSAFPPNNTPPHWITLTSPSTLGDSFPPHAGS